MEQSNKFFIYDEKGADEVLAEVEELAANPANERWLTAFAKMREFILECKRINSLPK